MVDMAAPYAGAYVRSEELPPEQRIHVVIQFATVEQIGVDQKPAAVLSVARAQDGQPWPRKIVLNKSNALTLTAAFGNDSATWVNQPITIWRDPSVMYGGKVVGGLKVAVGHQASPVVPGGVIPLPGPVAPAQAHTPPGNRASQANPQTVNMAGHEVPLPSGMPSAPPNPGKPVWAGPGSELDDELPL
jgi:hypothetical protein